MMANYEHHGSRRSRYNAKGPLPPLPLHHHQVAPPASRTPGAWMVRDVNLSGSRPTSTLPHHPGSAAPYSGGGGRYPASTMTTAHHHGAAEMQHHQLRPSSSATTSSDGEEVPMVRGPRRPASHLRGTPADRRSVLSRTSRLAPHHHHQQQSQQPPMTFDLTGMTAGMVPSHYGPVNGTLRSSRSVPALALPYDMAGGPGCPVHGHPGPAAPAGYPMSHQPIYDMGPGLRRFGSMMDVRSMAAGPIAMVNYGTEKKSFVTYGPPPPFAAAMTLPRPPTAFYPGPPPRPMMMQTFDPNFKLGPAPLAGKMMRERPVVYEETVCCKGHLIVLWIILGVVTVGVISGIILSVTMN